MPTLRSSLVALATILSAPLAAAETFSLVEDPSSGRTFAVSAEVTADGTFSFQPPEQGGKPVEHPVVLKGDFRYVERRLPAAGRDEAAWRSLREYEQADSTIRVGEQASTPTLRQSRRRVVARAAREGVAAYATDGAMTADEVELLPYPGDSLLLPALLPSQPVSVGGTWSPDPWVASALAGTEVAFDQKLTCRLETVRDGRATVTFEGRVEGAVKGATSETTLKGSLEYDLKTAAVVAADLTQSEKRAIGPLSPGMTLTLRSEIRRSPASAEAMISDDVAEAVPLEPPAESLRIEHRAPFAVSLTCDRDWRLFHRTGQLLILRLLDRGGLVAQCNVAPGPKVAPGERTPEQVFQEDIRRSLGEQLAEIVAAEEVKGDDLAVYRVTATGAVRGSERVWRYYLVTAPDGRQAAFVVTVEPNDLRRLADRDLELVTSLQFLPPADPRAARE